MPSATNLSGRSARVLLVTNDFPPTIGGIQSYLRDFVDGIVARHGADSVIVFASIQDEHQSTLFDASVDYTVVRWPRKVMLPTPATVREMMRLIAENQIDTVWFGAAAPLAVMGSAARRAGAKRIVASTHGHEVGWSMVPGARHILRIIGRSSDALTYVSEYTRRRFARAFGAHPDYVAVPSGVDTAFFAPANPAERVAIRDRHGLGEVPYVVVASRLVPRKGQDQLIRAWPCVQQHIPDARLGVIGDGRYGQTLRAIAQVHGVFTAVDFHGRLSRTDMRDLVAASDVFAMPARTRGGGLDVEGLGIVYLEAQACGVPVIAGRSGGAPETVSSNTGLVIDGRDERALASAIVELLDDPQRRTALGQAGREHVAVNFSWEVLVARLCCALGLE